MVGRCRLATRGAWIAVVPLALGPGCERDAEAGPSSEILAAHRVIDGDPEGLWLRYEKSGIRALIVRQEEDSGRWVVRSEGTQFREAGGPAVLESAREATILGDLANGILTLDAPLHGSVRLHLCRFGHEELLLPENAVRFERDRAPLGVVYTRFVGDEVVFPTPPVVEPLPAGVWEGVDCPEWVWLRIVPTGTAGGFVVRTSRVLDDDLTPVNGFLTATWRGEVLSLDSPFFDSSTWCIRRHREAVWLVPSTASANLGEVAEPEGTRFRLVRRVTTTCGPQWADPDRLPDFHPEGDFLEEIRYLPDWERY